jgi:hypothetical protein
VAADDVRQPLHQKIIDFLDELELFIGEKPIFTKKKIRRHAICRDHDSPNKKCCSPAF